jgi:hypothetical protein
MQKRKRQQPSYRQRKGYDQAIVTLTDSVTRYRKDYWLGPYNSPQSRELYHRVLAQWESSGRRLPVTLDDKPADITQVSVGEVLNDYWPTISDVRVSADVRDMMTFTMTSAGEMFRVLMWNPQLEKKLTTTPGTHAGSTPAAPRTPGA